MAKQNLSIKALNDFSCLAGDCPDHCCGSWLVKVTDENLALWSDISNGDIREKFLQRVTSVETGTGPATVLSKNSQNNCANLAANGLCELQKECGHEALPQTCRDFPRLNIENDWRRLQTVELSCPEIASKIINADGGLILGNRNAKTSGSSDTQVKINKALDQLFFMVIAEKKYPANLRLYYLAWKMRNLLEMFQAHGVQSRLLKFPRALVKSELYSLLLNYQKDGISISQVHAEQFWLLAYRILGDITTLNIRDLGENNQSVARLAMQADDGAKLYRFITELRNEVAAEVSIHYRSKMEKLIPVLLMNRGLPWRPFADNQVATYINAMVPLALLNLVLWLSYKETGHASTETLIEAIYKLERRLKHTNDVYYYLEENPSLLELNRNPEFYLEII